RLYPPLPVPVRTNTLAGASNQVPGGTNIPGAGNSTISSPSPFPVAPLAPAFARPEAEERLLVVENNEARLTFSSHGGGLKMVELKEYQESIECVRQRGARTNKLATLNAQARVPALALLDGAAIQGDGLFELTRTTNGVRAEKAFANGL